MTVSRTLSNFEKSHVPAFIKRDINIDLVQIISRPWTILTPKRITVARGYKIFWPLAPDEASDIPRLSHLIHELVHVWQYNHLVVSLYSPLWLDRRYKYKLDLAKPFLSYGLEQQAAIIQDIFLSSQNYRSVYAKVHTDPLTYLQFARINNLGFRDKTDDKPPVKIQA